MAEKKNEVITFRTEEWVKTELQRVADLNKWSVAQTVNQIVINYLINPQPGSITVKADDLIKAAVNIRKEGPNKGVELAIRLMQPEDSDRTDKYLEYRVIECGGLGCVDDYFPLKEMSYEEIQDIP